MKRTALCILAGLFGIGIATAQPLDAPGSGSPPPDEFPASYGAEGFPATLVWTVDKGGHAQECGLKEWDLILEIDGLAVDALGGPESLASWIRGMPPGTVRIKYFRPSVRAGEFKTGSVTCTVPSLGMRFLAIFLVGNVPPGSDAEALGALTGDYITSVPTAPAIFVMRRNERWGEVGEEYMKSHRLTLP